MTFVGRADEEPEWSSSNDVGTEYSYDGTEERGDNYEEDETDGSGESDDDNDEETNETSTGDDDDDDSSTPIGIQRMRMTRCEASGDKRRIIFSPLILTRYVFCSNRTTKATLMRRRTTTRRRNTSMTSARPKTMY